MRQTILAFFVLALFSSALVGQKVPVTLRTEVQEIPDTEGEYELFVYGRNFNGILSMQMSIRWDADQYQYLEFVPQHLPDLSSVNINDQTSDQGFLRLLWVDPTLESVNLPSDRALFSLHMQSDTGPPSIQISNDPMPIEVIDSDEMPRVLVLESQ